MARPSAYSPKLADRILDAVADGATLSAAATACDVKRQTVRGWLDHDPAFVCI